MWFHNINLVFASAISLFVKLLETLFLSFIRYNLVIVGSLRN